ncbi:hypothetical protein ECDEC4A_1404 [Escherichia coli DEC4A]|nr:hypothetical protein ECDEC4A_1404 [Escherichia coli DEC4A]
MLFLFFSNYHRYPFISGCAWRGLFFYDQPLADGHPVI